jgi:uncharacterized alkaline shock family protein YloU
MTHVLTTPDGTVVVPDGVLLDIAVRAAESGGGVRVRRRRAIDLEAGLVRLSVSARRGDPIVEAAERAQEDVVEALRTMCALDPRVDVHVGELHEVQG